MTTNTQQVPRHKVFISYYHKDDQQYKNRLVQALENNFVNKSIKEGDIQEEGLPLDEIRRIIRDDHIADATVTIVLIGKCTWQRKHVDWEISASLIHNSKNNPRNGLIGVLLPSHPDYGKDPKQWNQRLIPPRLADNIKGNDPFAIIYKWPKNRVGRDLLPKIHEAFQRRLKKPDPCNTLKLFKENRSGDCSRGWQSDNRR